MSAETTAVIVVNWNGWKDTVDAVRSAHAMRPAPGNVVVVDNASTDDSEDRLRELCPDAVILQSGKNLGFGGGNNIGIRWALAHGASGVWLLNSDAIADEGALGAILDAAKARPRAGVVGTRIYYADRRDVLQCWGGGWADVWTGRSSEFSTPVEVSELHYITGCSMYLPRTALEKSGMFDEGFFMYFEDADLGFRYRAEGFELAVADTAKVWHKGGATARGSSLQSAWRTQSLLRFLRLHSPIYAVSALSSTLYRTLAFARRGQWAELRRLAHDLPAWALAPDWRRDPRR
ncbi:MAG: glycosyltransferase family 2 protein [Deltaproteobacteria bacterium]